MNSDWMNDSSGHYKEIVGERSTESLYHYFFVEGRSGHAKLNAVDECVKQLWEEGLQMLMLNHKTRTFCYLDHYVLERINQASDNIKLLKNADAMIGSESRSAEEMHALLVDKKTSVLMQLFILDKCIGAGWAEPLSLLIARTEIVYHNHDTKAAKGLIYYSVHEKATEGLKAIASGLRALDEKGKVAEVIRQKPAAQTAAQPMPQAQRRY